jgi:hypothetical protein
MIYVLWEPHLPDDDEFKSPWANILYCGRRAFEKHTGRAPMLIDTQHGVAILSKPAKRCDCSIPQHETWCPLWRRYSESEERNP